MMSASYVEEDQNDVENSDPVIEVEIEDGI